MTTSASTLFKPADHMQTFVFPHLALGSEAQWPVLLDPVAPNSLGTEYVQYFLLNNPDWDYNDFDYSIVELADQLDPGNATANDFNLSPFHAHGGKLLQYHGEADALIATGSSIYFYNHVLRTLVSQGLELDSWYRFFLVPGMQHCLGTPTDVNAPWYFAGPNQAGSLGVVPGTVYGVPGFRDARHDALLALMAWRENGTAPDYVSFVAPLSFFLNSTLTQSQYRLSARNGIMTLRKTPCSASVLCACTRSRPSTRAMVALTTRVTGCVKDFTPLPNLWCSESNGLTTYRSP